MCRTLALLALLASCDAAADPAPIVCDPTDAAAESSTGEPVEPPMPPDEIACNAAALCIAQVCEYPVREWDGWSEADRDAIIEDCASECDIPPSECGPTCVDPFQVALELVEPCLRRGWGQCWVPVPECPAFWG